MEHLILISIGLGIAVAYFAAFWLLQYVIGNSAVVDVGWAASVALIGSFFAWQTDGDLTRRILAACLLWAWAIRLSYYLFLRWRKHPEDERYTQLKNDWGDQAQVRMFRFYQMQGLGAFLFALPIYAVGIVERPLFWLDYVAIAVWLIAIGGEALSDHQLAQFKKDAGNRGEVCRDGLWRYSRHPNYFFEWLHWWTYVFFAITLPVGWLTMLAPLAMWYFLTKVTGIPTTERQAVISRGDKYREYQRTTNAFFPWFPRTSETLS